MTGSRLSRRTLGRLTVAAAAVTLAGRAGAQSVLTISAVNYPLAYFAERIAGDLANVNFPIPSDVDPSFWRPGIAEISAIQGSDIILLNGAGFADWTARTTLPRSRTVDTASTFEDAFIATESITHSHGEGGQHSHTGTANYLWLDFAQAQMQATAIAEAIVRRLPEADAQIAANLNALVADLDDLDTQAREIAEAAADIGMIASHPRYQYLARAYGFDIAAMDWDPREPVSDQQMADLAEAAASTEAQIFIWEAEPDDQSRSRVDDLGLASVTFPPLANRPARGDFVTAMSASLDRLREAVQPLTGG